MVVCLERVADLHVAQLMPLPLTVSCFTKIQIGFAFLVPAHLGSPGKRAIKRVCACACACVRACVCVCHTLAFWRRFYLDGRVRGGVSSARSTHGVGHTARARACHGAKHGPQQGPTHPDKRLGSSTFATTAERLEGTEYTWSPLSPKLEGTRPTGRIGRFRLCIHRFR